MTREAALEAALREVLEHCVKVDTPTEALDHIEGLCTRALDLDPDSHDQALREQAIELARDRHAHGSDNEIEVDDNADISPNSEGGVWVQGWLYVPPDVLR